MQPEIIRPDDLANGSGTRVVLAVNSLQEAVSVPPAQWAGDLAMRALGDGALLAEQTSQGPSVNLAVQALLYAGRLSEHRMPPMRRCVTPVNGARCWRM